jgi:hypothetical protein
MEENALHVIIVAISSLGSVGAWRFYESKLKYKAQRAENPQKLMNALFQIYNHVSLN